MNNAPLDQLHGHVGHIRQLVVVLESLYLTAGLGGEVHVEVWCMASHHSGGL